MEISVTPIKIASDGFEEGRQVLGDKAREFLVVGGGDNQGREILAYRDGGWSFLWLAQYLDDFFKPEIWRDSRRQGADVIA